MSVNKDFAVIIPVHKLDTPEQENLFLGALKSVLTQDTVLPGNVLIIAGDDSVRQAFIRSEVQPLAYPKGMEVFVAANFADERNNTSFQAQVNKAVTMLPEHVKYFTVLEFDDVLRPNYFRHAEKYTQGYPDTAVFLPIVEDVDSEGQFLKYTNEVLWTPNFTDNLGLLDHEALKGYANFHLPGAVLKKEAFLAVGGLKESFELVFNYEFLLRVTQQDLVVRSIPKVLYNHVDGREGSLFKTLTEGRTSLVEEEIRFWFDAAHRECFFTEDRKPTYQPQ